jgi:hypothetical protein
VKGGGRVPLGPYGLSNLRLPANPSRAGLSVLTCGGADGSYGRRAFSLDSVTAGIPVETMNASSQ